MLQTQSLKALPEEENHALLVKAKGGDEEAKQLYFAHNFRLMTYMANKFRSSKLSYEDRLSAAQFGFLKAYNTFDLDKGIKFVTYAARCIQNEMLMALRKDKNVLLVSLEEPLSTDVEGNALTLADVMAAPEDAGFSNFENSELIRDVLTAYKGKQRDLNIFLDGINGMLQRDVAEKYGVSQSYISRIALRVEKALQKVNNNLMTGVEDEVKGKSISPKLLGQLKYCFTDTYLSDFQVSKVIGCSYMTVKRYRDKYKAKELEHVVSDQGTALLLQEVSNKAKAEKKQPMPVVKLETVPEPHKPVVLPVQALEEQTLVITKPPVQPAIAAKKITLSFDALTKDDMLAAFSSLYDMLSDGKKYEITFTVESVPT